MQLLSTPLTSRFMDIQAAVCLSMMSFIDFAAQPCPLIFQSDAFVNPLVWINDHV